MPKLTCMWERDYISFSIVFGNLKVGDYLYCFGYNSSARDPEIASNGFEYIYQVINTDELEEYGEVEVLDIWDALGDQALEGEWNMDKDTLGYYQIFIKI